MTRAGVITQARMTSSRLPGKVLLSAGGVSMLQHQFDRLSRAGLDVFVATTSNAADDPIVEAASSIGVGTFRGSESDVLGRFAGAARMFELDVVVRVTSDCPLIDGVLIRDAVDRFLTLADESAYVSNVLERTYPRGFDFEVFSASALFQADTKANRPSEREHVTPYLYANSASGANLHAIRRDHDASGYRVTLDTREDLELIRRLVEDFGAAKLGAEEIIDVLDGVPSLASINAHVEQKKLR